LKLITMQHLLCPALLGALCSSALAGDITKPSGFNIETVDAAGPIAAVLDDGSWLLATPGPSLTRRAPDGTLSLYAEGFQSLDGVSQSTLSGDIAVGDLISPEIIWLLRDLNNDGDALDAGERTAYPTTHPELSNGLPALAFDVAFEPGTDVLYLIGTTNFMVFPSLPAIVRYEKGAGQVYYDALGFSGGLAFRDGVLYAGNLDSSFFFGEVITLADGNGDGDAMDPGESVVYATGLSGASQLAFDAEGGLWLSGGFGSAGCVGRLLPDTNEDGFADGVEECVFEGFGFSTGLTLFEGSGGFIPGSSGEGELWMGDFGFAGNIVARSAPLAEIEVLGTVGPGEEIEVILRGEPDADSLFIVSLDTVGSTLPGIGDLCLGFSELHAISPLLVLDGAGEASCRLQFPPLGNLVGEDFVFQGFAIEDGEIGVGNSLDFIFGS
jgi:hypothetical protein